MTTKQTPAAARDAPRPPKRFFLRATLFLAALSALLLPSCRREVSVPVYPVRGNVLYKGRPAIGATVVFHCLETASGGRPVPQAVVATDGSFRLSTYTQHDGASPGRYAVTIQWPSDAAKEEDGTPAGPDRLGRRYADPKRTPLQVEIRAEPNELEPFHVK